ncbi:MAG: hypothetical protein LBV12_01600 [Puniceicoccales bacterium]|jgi:hypothetical protein|nr:hypothetical protein [Puniceicoccales bacterium]
MGKTSIVFVLLGVCSALLYWGCFSGMNRKAEGDSTDPSQLCGINSLYVALKLLGEDELDYLALLEKFPQAKEAGVSLREIEQYLVQKGYCCQYAKLEKETLPVLDQAKLTFVLNEAGSPHIFLMRSKNNGAIQIIDPPHDPFLFEAEKMRDRSFAALVVSEAPLGNMPMHNRAWLGVSAGCLGLGCLLILAGSRKTRKSP